VHTIDSDVMTPFLRVLAKKGTCEVLSHIQSQESMHYNEVMKYLLDGRIIESRSCVTTILNNLKDYDLLEKTAVGNNPPRTCYRLNKNGMEVVSHLKKMEKITRK